MPLLKQHIVLIGFKHVGKTAVGQHLAKKVVAPFIDLDKKIEQAYEKEHKQKLSCRQIMQSHGEDFFRALEAKTLNDVISHAPAILSLGGGTPLSEANQKILESCVIIHITAPKGVVFERILLSGRPPFFHPGESLLESFNKLWDQRMHIYEKIRDITVENHDSLDHVANEIIAKLNLEVRNKS